MFNEILNEGGAAGHMNHLYDNGDLTFSKMKEIFSAAASGKLVGTEKTDGQNLMISFSVKDGKAKGVRNKTEIKGGGLTAEELAAKFADKANPALKETFSDALRVFEKAVQGLDHNTQIELFGPDTNIYYNAEVMDPRAPNVVQYDTKALVIHRAGHGQFDRETGKKTQTDVSEKAKKLEDVIQSAQEKIKDENYGLQVNAIKNLQALSDKQPLNQAIEKIDKILSATNYLGGKSFSLNDGSTINEFMMARVLIIIKNMFDKKLLEIGEVKNVAKMNIAKKILGVGDLTATQIYKDLSPKEKIFVKENILTDEAKNKILKTAIFPVEEVVSEFSSEMLKSLNSAFVIDNPKEVKRIQSEINQAIEAIKKSGSEEAMAILKYQMQKLKNVEKITTAAEGFVFDYDGVTYKFTGNFAPANQLLGLFKYGRGKVPPLKKEVVTEAKITKKANIAVIPGSFKPPHKGHLDMVKKAASLADEVTILVSPMSRELPDGQEVTFDISKKIWDEYLKAENLHKKVKVLLSPASSPVRASYEFIGNKEENPDFAQSGQTIILVTSLKGGDDKRFIGVEKYAKQGVAVSVLSLDPTGNISATDMRTAISENNLKKLVKFLPNSIKNKNEMAKQILSIFFKKEASVKENIINDIINSLISERIIKKGSKYCLVSKKTEKNLGCYRSKKGAKKREKQVQYFKHIKEMSAVGAGAVNTGAVAVSPVKVKIPKEEK